MMFCPDCHTNLDAVPVEDHCPECGGHKRSATVTAGTAEVTASALPPRVSIIKDDHRPWAEQWLRVLRRFSGLRAAYSPDAPTLGNAEVEDLATTFFVECDDLRDWLKEDLGALPGVTKSDIGQHWRASPALRRCNDISRTHKHHTPGGKAARIRRTDTDSSGIRVTIELDWASESAPTVDALELADDCVKSWRDFFTTFGIAEP